MGNFPPPVARWPLINCNRPCKLKTVHLYNIFEWARCITRMCEVFLRDSIYQGTYYWYSISLIICKIVDCKTGHKIVDFKFISPFHSQNKTQAFSSTIFFSSDQFCSQLFYILSNLYYIVIVIILAMSSTVPPTKCWEIRDFKKYPNTHFLPPV